MRFLTLATNGERESTTNGTANGERLEQVSFSSLGRMITRQCKSNKELELPKMFPTARSVSSI